MKIHTIREKGLPVWKVKLDIKGYLVNFLSSLTKWIYKK